MNRLLPVPKMPARDTRNELPNLRHNMFPFAPCWENICFCFCLLICSPIGPAAPDHFGRVRQLERYCCFATRPAVWRYYRVIKKGESSNVSRIWLPFNVLQIPCTRFCKYSMCVAMERSSVVQLRHGNVFDRSCFSQNLGIWGAPWALRWPWDGGGWWTWKTQVCLGFNIKNDEGLEAGNAKEHWKYWKWKPDSSALQTLV